MKKFVLTSLILLLFGSIVFSQSIVWKQLASLPAGYRNGEAVALNNKIYYVPGYDSDVNYMNRNFYMYDPALNLWTKMADLPNCKTNFALAEVSGKIYAIGGDPFLKSNYAYTPETNIWATLSSMPTGRQHIDCGVYENEIYVIAGITSWTSISKKNEVFNVLTNSWSKKTDIPTLRNNPAIETLDSLIYVIGGGGSNKNIWSPFVATVECYNVKTDTWQQKADLPYVLFKPYTVVINNQILVLGGSTIDNGQEVCSDKVLLYKAESDEWEETTPLPANINIGFSSTSIGNKIYVIGGMECSPPNKPFATVYEGELVVTDVDKDDFLLNDFVLYQNYPNPFNPYTKIKYSIPKAAYVSLKIYNALGQEAAQLVNNNMNAGTFNTEWYASDYLSGIYFYRLTADGFVETKKLVLLK